MADPTWRDALLRYRTRTDLVTRARRRPFIVQTDGAVLVVTPATGRPRPITEREWDRSIPLLHRAGRAALTEATFNSSYIEVIVDDIRRSYGKAARDDREARRTSRG